MRNYNLRNLTQIEKPAGTFAPADKKQLSTEMIKWLSVSAGVSKEYEERWKGATNPIM